MSNQASIRAFVAHTMIQRAEALPAAERGALDLAGPRLATLRAALSISYVPLGDLMYFEEALRAQLGDARFRAFQRDVTLRYLEGPVVKGLWDAARRLLGLSPAGMIRWVPRAWDTILRGTGTIAHEAVGDGEAHIHLDGFPAEHLRSGTYLLTGLAAFDAILEMTKREGSADLIHKDLVAGKVTFRVRWKT